MPAVQHCVLSVIVKNFIQAINWTDNGPSPRSDLRLDELGRFVLPASSEARGSWLYISKQHRSFLELYDGAHTIDAILLDENFKNLAVQTSGRTRVIRLDDFSIGLHTYKPEGRAYLQLLLLVRHFALVPTTENIHGIRLPVTEQTNIKGFLAKVENRTETHVPRADESKTLESATRQNHLRIYDVSDDQDTEMTTEGENPQPEDCAHGSSQEALVQSQAQAPEQIFPTELQRWETLISQGYIPRYGSNPKETSKEQVRLLSCPEAWDPPPTGKESAQRYIPSGDLEELIEYTDNPGLFADIERFAKLTDTQNSTKLDKNSGKTSADEDSIVAYAQQVRRLATPDGTALGPSQWAPSPDQRANEKFAQKDTTAADIEESSSDEEVHDGLPPDTDEETSPEKPNLVLTSEAVNRAEADLSTALEQSQGLPETLKADRASTKDQQNALRDIQMSSQEECLTLDPKVLNRQQEPIGFTTDNNDSLEYATAPEPLEPALPLRTATEPNTEDSNSESEIEMSSPQGTNDVPSTMVSIVNKKINRRPSIHVEQTPYSDGKVIRLPGEDVIITSKTTGEIEPANSRSNIAETPAPHHTPAQEIVIEQRPVTPTALPSSSAKPVQSSPSEQLLPSGSLEALSPQEKMSLKRKVRDSQESPSSIRRTKLYKVRAESPIFSQDIRDLAQSTPVVDKLRRQHFNPKLKFSQRNSSNRGVGLDEDPGSQERGSQPEDAIIVDDASSSSDEESGGPQQAEVVLDSTQRGKNLQNVGSLSIQNRQLETSSATRSQLFGDSASNSKAQRKSAPASAADEELPESDSDKSSLAERDMMAETHLRQLGDIYYGELSGLSEARGSLDVHELIQHHGRDNMDVDLPRESAREVDYAEPRKRSERKVSNSSAPGHGLFARFKHAYPEYHGDQKQFLAVCKKILSPKEDFAVMKNFFDDFVVRFAVEYRPYCMFALDEGEDPKGYEEWFEDNVDAAKFKGQVLNKSNITEFVSLTAQSVPSASTTPAPPLLPRPSTRDSAVSPPRRMSSASREPTRSMTGASGGSDEPRHRQNSSRPMSTTAAFRQPGTLPVRNAIDLTREQRKYADVDSPSLPLPKKSRRSLPWTSSSPPQEPLPVSPLPDRTVATLRQSVATANSRPGFSASARAVSSPGISTRSSPIPRHLPAVQKERAGISRVASTGAISSRKQQQQQQQQQQHQQSGTSTTAASDAPKKSKREAKARSQDEMKPMRKAIRDWEADEYSPMNVYARESRSVTAGAGNAFAKEAGIEPQKKANWQDKQVNIDNFKL